MRLAAATDVGMVRQENQDDYRAQQLSENEAWAVVCDGMGGVHGGKLASHTGCNSIQSFFAEKMEECSAGREKAFLMQAVQQANRDIFSAAQKDPELYGMGTTIVCVLVRENLLHLCHVGDSRCYLLREGALQQMTKDHSYVQELVDQGTITQEQAEHHPKKNVITRALGVDLQVAVEYNCIPLQHGDRVLLCSDGLTNMVSAAQLLELMAQDDFHAIPDEMVQAANKNGGADNITALLIGPEEG